MEEFRSKGAFADFLIDSSEDSLVPAHIVDVLKCGSLECHLRGELSSHKNERKGGNSSQEEMFTFFSTLILTVLEPHWMPRIPQDTGREDPC